MMKGLREIEFVHCTRKGPVRPDVPAVFRRCGAHPFAELPDKMAPVAMTGFTGDIRTAQIAGFQQAPGLLNAQVVDILQRGFSGSLLQQMRRSARSFISFWNSATG